MRTAYIILCVLAALDVPRANAETWVFKNGQPIEGRLSGVYGSIAVVTSSKGGTRLLSIDQFDDASLVRIAGFLARSGNKPSSWAESEGTIATSLRHRLQIMQAGKMVDFDPGTRPEPQLYLVYFGAHWCRPCREFSPHLVESYSRLKELAGDRLELVFVSSDHSYDDQALYAREIGMPWPILKFSDVGSVRPIERWEGPAIPDLIVITREGDLLYDSFRGEAYLGPQSVLDEVEPLLNAMNEDSEFCRRALHRLNVIEYVRAAATGTSSPKPYLLGLDRSHYQTLKITNLTALLAIDEHGCVTDVKIEPQIPTALEFELEQDAGRWLFLPAVVNGQPKSARVKLPIRF
jgi:thiol-disulfide isomerase/thioredoxin